VVPPFGLALACVWIAMIIVGGKLMDQWQNQLRAIENRWTSQTTRPFIAAQRVGETGGGGIRLCAILCAITVLLAWVVLEGVAWL
jgi:hypothetical protein